MMSSAFNSETTDPCRIVFVSTEVMMAQQEIHVATDRARAGSAPHIVRYVLGISLVLAIISMAVLVGAN